MIQKKTNKIDYGFRTGVKEFRTELDFDMPCNDERIIQSLKNIGAVIEYMTERTVYFHLDGIHLNLGHNWADQKYVFAQSTGLGLKIGEKIEKKVKHVINESIKGNRQKFSYKIENKNEYPRMKALV